MKEFFKTEWAKFREMTFAEKRWYIWEYYKLHIIGFAIAAFLLGSIINNTFINPPPNTFLYIGWLGNPVPFTTLSEMGNRLSIIVENPAREIVLFSNYNVTEDPQLNSAMQTRFFALMQTGAIDVFISSREGVQGWAEMGILQNVNGIKHDAISDRLITVSYVVDGTDELITDVMAVSLHGSPFMEYFGIPTDDMYMVLVGNAFRFDRVLAGLEVLLTC